MDWLCVAEECRDGFLKNEFCTLVIRSELQYIMPLLRRVRCIRLLAVRRKRRCFLHEFYVVDFCVPFSCFCDVHVSCPSFSLDAVCVDGSCLGVVDYRYSCSGGSTVCHQLLQGRQAAVIGHQAAEGDRAT